MRTNSNQKVTDMRPLFTQLATLVKNHEADQRIAELENKIAAVKAEQSAVYAARQ